MDLLLVDCFSFLIICYLTKTSIIIIIALQIVPRCKIPASMGFGRTFSRWSNNGEISFYPFIRN